jgi:hypothetical protein
MKKPRIRIVQERDLERIVHVAGHADQCDEPLLRRTGQEIGLLSADLKYLQKLIDKELTRRYKELAEKGNVK